MKFYSNPLTQLGRTTILIAILSFSACSKSATKNSPTSDNPIVGTVTQVQVDSKPTVSGVPAPSVNVQITFNKSILSQEFLYGADIQYSDFQDEGDDLQEQSQSVGHIPVTFRISGTELQLIADNRRLSASDVDHPELLISRYQIVAQTADTLTVTQADSSVFLGEVWQGAIGSGSAFYDPSGKTPKDHWTRSFDYVANGNYLLQQTSILSADGNIVEFEESVFPRSTLAVSSDFLKIPIDPASDRVTDLNPDADFLNRFRFLGGEVIYESLSPDVESANLAYGQHPDLSGAATMDWYVTPNAPDEVLPILKNAVEGWNRYFRMMKGFGHDVLSFRGRLPIGVYIGDPRYNVINWDSTRVAGAAYESQASDPETGKQSHSLIYMPAAWLQIGNDYWTEGKYADPAAATRSRTSGKIGRSSVDPRASRLSCMRDITDALALTTSGKLSADEAQKFSVQLLKQTLFHEVGHALGFAHEFKGSLAYNPGKPGSAFSWSIMDYNDFEIERAAFDAVDGSTGPLLEYDRQFLSALYDKKQENASTDALIPACEDQEADNLDGGVDPLCIRYDIQSDPTMSVQTAFDRVNLAQISGDVTLVQAIENVPAIALENTSLSGIKSADDLAAATPALVKALISPLDYYYSGGRSSIRYTTRVNMKSLLEFEDGILPDTYNANEMRARVFSGVQKSVAMTDVTDDVKTAYQNAVTTLVSQLVNSPYVASLEAGDRAAATKSLTAELQGGLDHYVQQSLPVLRTSILSGLTQPQQTSFYFLKSASSTIDYKQDIVAILLQAVTDSKIRAQSERLAAAKSLITFKGQLYGDPAITQAIQALTSERASALSSDTRDAAQAILKVLSG